MMTATRSALTPSNRVTIPASDDAFDLTRPRDFVEAAEWLQSGSVERSERRLRLISLDRLRRLVASRREGR
jgi:hypothetical protein